MRRSLSGWGCFALALALASLSACGDDDGGDGTSGTDRDAGLVWMPRDAATSDDGGTTTRPDGASSADAGLAGRTCAAPRMPVPSPLLPRCRARTATCVDGCATAMNPDACRDACFAADDHEVDSTYGLNCPGCVFLQLFACIDATDCHDTVAAFFCCVEDRCTGQPDGCAQEMCGAEIEALFTCAYYAAPECLDLTGGVIGECFAESDPVVDAGMGDADAGVDAGSM